MPIEIVAVKCSHCTMLLSKDTQEYLIVQTGLVVGKHCMPPGWKGTEGYIKTGLLTIQADSIFCNTQCLINALQMQDRKNNN